MINYLILFTAVVGVPVGQVSSANPKELTNRLHQCSSLTEDAERLKCYDREAASLYKAIADGSLSVISKSQIEKAHREGFGYNDGDRRRIEDFEEGLDDD